ncbi:MAG: Gfo/Idh/MocA family oxidoreductase [Spirochaetales bacterium]|nr:Gfo/Idh/MocA family oxidoreductase [Spirochaetales bacterium]
MLGIAILGSGAIAAVHADAYLRHKDRCELRAVCDLYPEKAQALVESKALTKAAVYKDAEEALSRTDIDAVSVCLPPGAHAKTAIQALRAGKHVLVEKPMATSLAECDEMIKSAEDAGRLLCCVAQNRYKTPNSKVRTLLGQGVAGRVLHATVNSLWWRGGNYYDLWWRGAWDTECGGCVTSHAVHQVDLLLWMLGKPERVTAVIKNVAHDNSECEDLGVAILEYPGMLAQLTASLVAHDEEQEMIFQAERGRLSVPWKTAACRALPNGFPQDAADVKNELQARYDELPDLPLEGHPAQIGNFLAAIKGEAPLDVTGRDGRAALELIMAIYKSSALRQPVSLPLDPGDEFYRRETMTARMPRFYQKKRAVENFADAKITLGRDVGR